MKKWLMAIMFGVMLVLGACGGGNADDNGATDNNAGDNNSGEETADADLDNGEEVFQQNCASCHGDDLSGQSGPSLEAVGSDHSVDDIKDVIEEGPGNMPAGLVSGDDENDVAEWLATHD